MTSRKRTLQILTGSGLLLLASSLAQAGTLVTTPTTYIDTLNLSGVTAGYCIGPYAASGCSAEGDTLGSTPTPDTVTFLQPTGNGENFEFWDANSSGTTGDQFEGNFNNGDLLLATVVGNNQIEFEFSNPISAFGVDIQDYNYTDPFTAYILVNDGLGTGCSVSGDCSVVSNSSNNPDNDPVFIGVTSTNNFSTVLLTMTDTSSNMNNDYVLDNISFTVGAFNSSPGEAPEPSTIAMMIGGLGVLAWKARKRVKA